MPPRVETSDVVTYNVAVASDRLGVTLVLHCNHCSDRHTIVFEEEEMDLLMNLTSRAVPLARLLAQSSPLDRALDRHAVEDLALLALWLLTHTTGHSELALRDRTRSVPS